MAVLDTRKQAAQSATKPTAKSRVKRWLPTAADFFVLPYVLFLLAFGILPGIYALILSFANFSNGTPQYFAEGIQNYLIAFHDFRFASAFTNMFRLPHHLRTISALSGSPASRCSCTCALAGLRDVMRTIYFIPGAATGATSVLIALFMLDPQVSPFRGLLTALHMDQFIVVIQPSHLPADLYPAWLLRRSWRLDRDLLWRTERNLDRCPGSRHHRRR